jgi:hypothetical protein
MNPYRTFGVTVIGLVIVPSGVQAKNQVGRPPP